MRYSEEDGSEALIKQPGGDAPDRHARQARQGEDHRRGHLAVWPEMLDGLERADGARPRTSRRRPDPIDTPHRCLRLERVTRAPERPTAGTGYRGP